MTGYDAAGILFGCPEDNSILLLRRSASTWPGFWGIPGGSMDDTDLDLARWKYTRDDAPLVTALRECQEEIGSVPEHKLLFRHDGIFPHGFRFVTYYAVISEEEKLRWTPTIRVNQEHDAFIWAPVTALPDPLHPGIVKVLDLVVV